jgi:hypothetical protein
MLPSSISLIRTRVKRSMHDILNSFPCSGFALIVIHVTWKVHLDYVCRLCDGSNHSKCSVRLVQRHLYIKWNNNMSKTLQSVNHACIIMYISSSFRCLYHHLGIYWIVDTYHVPTFKNPDELEVLVWANICLNFFGTICGGVTEL